MAVLFDSESFKDLASSGGTWTHTPVGTPRGIAVLIASDTITDTITSVAYGGSTLARVAAISGGAGSEPGIAYLYFRGTIVPASGTVNVVATGGTITGWAVTMTANQAWTESAGTATMSSTSLANPSGTIPSTSGDSGLAVGVCFTGQNAPASTTPNPGYTALTGSASGGRDFGNQSAVAAQGGAYGANVSMGWVQTADDVAAIVALIRETAPTLSSFPPRVNFAVGRR